MSNKSSLSINLRQKVEEEQQQQRQVPKVIRAAAAAAAAAATAAVAAAPALRGVAFATNTTTPSSMVQQPVQQLNLAQDEEKFLRDFENRVLDVVRQSTHRFPYKHSVIWSIEFAQDKEYLMHVVSNPNHS